MCGVLTKGTEVVFKEGAHCTSRCTQRLTRTPPHPGNLNLSSVLLGELANAFNPGPLTPPSFNRELARHASELTALLAADASAKVGRRRLSSLSRWFEGFGEGRGVHAGPLGELLLPSMPRLAHGGGVSAAGGIAVPEGVQVVGFGSSVHVFKSKQMPKRLTMFGSDLR